MKLLLSLFLASSIFFFINQDSDFTTLYSLHGTWAMTTKTGLLYEQWKKVSSSELESRNFRISGNDTLMQEQVRLVQKADGIFYISTVQDQNNKKAVPFKLVENNDKRFVFENKEHDFPQRIIYHLISNDSLVARIEGEENNTTKGFNYYFKRLE